MSKLLNRKFTIVLAGLSMTILCTNAFCADDGFANTPFKPSITLDSLNNSDDCVADFAKNKQPTWKSKITLDTIATEPPNNNTQSPAATNAPSGTDSSSSSEPYSISNVYSPENSQTRIDNMVGTNFTDYATQAGSAELNKSSAANTTTPTNTVSFLGVGVTHGAKANGAQVGPTIEAAQALPAEVKVSPSMAGIKRGDTYGAIAQKYRNELLASGVPAKDIPPLWGKGGLVEKLAAYNDKSNPNKISIDDGIRLPIALQKTGDKGEEKYEIDWDGNQPDVPLNPNYTPPVYDIEKMVQGTYQPTPNPLNVANTKLNKANENIKEAQNRLFDLQKNHSHNYEAIKEAKDNLIAAHQKSRTAQQNVKVAESNDPVKKAETKLEVANQEFEEAKDELFTAQKYKNSHDYNARKEAMNAMILAKNKVRTAEQALKTAQIVDPVNIAEANVIAADKAVKIAQQQLFNSQKYVNSGYYDKRKQAIEELILAQNKRRTAKEALKLIKGE